MSNKFKTISVIKLSNIINLMEKSNNIIDKINVIILKKSIPLAENYYYDTYINFFNPFLPFYYCKTNGLYFVKNSKFKMNSFNTSINNYINTIGLNIDCKITLSHYDEKLLDNYLQ